MAVTLATLEWLVPRVGPGQLLVLELADVLSHCCQLILVQQHIMGAP